MQLPLLVLLCVFSTKIVNAFLFDNPGQLPFLPFLSFSSFLMSLSFPSLPFRSAARDSIPQERNSFVNFQAKTGVEEIAFFDVTRTGEILSRLSEDTQIIKNAATTNVSEAMKDLAITLMGLSFMFATSWKLTLLALAVVPVIAVCKFGHFLRELSHKTQTAAAVASSIAEKVIGLFSGGLNAMSTLSVIVIVGSSVSSISFLLITTCLIRINGYRKPSLIALFDVDVTLIAPRKVEGHER